MPAYSNLAFTRYEKQCQHTWSIECKAPGIETTYLTEMTTTPSQPPRLGVATAIDN
jgi:hypothetical protein